MTGAEILQQRAIDKERRNTIRTLLEGRFGEMPAAAVKQIEQADVDLLWTWIERFAKAQTLDDVFGPSGDDSLPSH